MDKEDAIGYITHVNWRQSRLGLGRMRELLRRMGNPQNKLKFIHIAGTNGKSTTSAMLAGVLAAAGYTAGLYTSPYVNVFNERMQVNGVPIPDDELVAVTGYVKGFAGQMEDHPTEFELVTAIAFEWFCRRGCHLVALEVGLGGRLDATNVIETPLLAIITTIDLDHTEILGDSLEQIAAEKAGIIKAGGQVLAYPQAPQVDAVLKAACAQANATLHRVDLAPLKPGKASLEGQHFAYGALQDLFTPLLGSYQLCNAATVIAAVQLLQQAGYKVEPQAVRSGLANTRWPARFELLRTGPAFIVDGGHNPQGARQLVDNLQRYFPGQKVRFVMGVMADKDYAAMLQTVLPLAEAFYCVAPDYGRALPPQALAAAISALPGAPVAQVCQSPAQGALQAIKEAGEAGVVCAFGSFYMAGHIRAAVLGSGE